MTTPELLERLESRERLTSSEYLQVAETAPLQELRRLADDLRKKLHPDNIVTYIVDRNINYSNICSAVCTFCAFFRKPGSSEGYVLSFDEIFRKVEETLELGGSGILMQGGLHPDLPLEWYEELLSQLKRRYGIHLHCFSPPEIYAFSQIFHLSIEEVLRRLKGAGLDSVPGGGAEILVDEVRKKNTNKCNTNQWLEVMETAHRLGLPTTATMMFGLGETPAHRLEHLQRLYYLQQKTRGFVAFIPWTLQPDNTVIGRKNPDRVPAEEYLRWLALARVYLDNIPNIQVSWLTQGIDVGRQGLHYGANDMGSIMIEENVITPAGAHHRATEDLLRHSILAEGFQPMKRKANYLRLERLQDRDEPQRRGGAEVNWARANPGPN
ncbi:MAG: dehypoxanthine futalosine cyclase [Acidobacteria bacterium]|nr:MAG: dehypoxanthine futalosine cyclase [Acidobacteriota bacterium]